MMNITFELYATALLPVLVAVVVYLLEKTVIFKNMNYWVKQIIFGLVFGALAILGTERGVAVAGAQVNSRDASVLIGGLMFGWPTGIIAGVIGGVERWIAVAWGVGSYTRVACSVSTAIAGFYAAALRKYMFEDKKPGWLISLAIGVVMEVFHLTMVFITNMSDPERAMAVVKACAIPMITINGIAVMLASVALSLFKDRKAKQQQHGVRISQTIQRWLLLTVLLAFAVTSFFVFQLQTRLATTQADQTLSMAITDVADDISDASDTNLLNAARSVSKEATLQSDLQALAEKYDVAEISIVKDTGDHDAVIVASNNKDFINFHFNSGEQSREFLSLLDDTEECVQEYGAITSNPNIKRKYAAVKTDYGFVQVGYDAEHFQRDIDKRVIGITKNRHVGKTGYMFIFNQGKQVVSLPDGLTEQAIAKAIANTKQPKEDTTFRINLGGEECYSRYIVDEGYYIAAALPVSEALQLRNIAMYVNTFMEILVFAVLFALIYQLIKRVVVNQIRKINQSLARITEGDLGVVVDVRTNEEFASLSDDINSTVDTLKHYIDEASARIDKELGFAKDIQASALPRVFPAFPKRKDFDIFASMNPAKEVGGDFYDFYLTDRDKLNFLIADVSGKGIPAAMFMMRAKTELKSRTESGLPICDVFTQGNAALCEGNDAGMFVTAWQGNIDLKTGVVQFANAGHNPPVVRHAATGKFEYLKSRAGFVLAGMDGLKYKTNELQLEPGDTIYLYTDGVTEATNAQTELYGEERLLSILNAKEYATVEELCKAVKADVDAFVGEAPQFDDITMVGLKYIGSTDPQIHFEEAKIEDIPVLTEFIEEKLNAIDCPMKTIIQFNVAIDEIYSNIVRYGYAEKPGPITVKLLIRDDPRMVHLRFEDSGVPYNPLIKEDPDVTLSAEERGIGGLGIFMVKKTMDNVRYKFENDHNILTITKRLDS